MMNEMLEFVFGIIAVSGIFFAPFPLMAVGLIVAWWLLSKFGIVRRFPIESYFRFVDLIVPLLVPLIWLTLGALLPCIKKGFFNVAEILVLGLCWGLCMIVRVFILLFCPDRYSLSVNLMLLLMIVLGVVCVLIIPGYGFDN